MTKRLLTHHLPLAICRAACAVFLLAASAARAQDEKAGDEDAAPPAEEATTNSADIPSAPGVRISNVALAPRDEKTALVTFDIAWSNAYRYGSFHDAAWVFFKVRADAQAPWQPVRLLAGKVVNPSGYSSGEGTPLEFVVPDGEDGFVGMFVRLAKDGRSDVDARKVTALVELKPGPRSVTTEIRAFGIEMAYVAEGPFYLGSNLKRLNRFSAYTDNEENTPPYRVTSSAAIPTGRQNGKLWAVGLMPEDNGEIPAAFPKGYAAFYCMKHPYWTQEFYAGFLNTLTAAQAKTRWYVEGQGKVIQRSGTAPNYIYTATTPGGRVPWLSWEDNAVVAAWAGLRPITEMEFEKAVRGPNVPELDDADLSFWGLSDVNTGDMYERQVSVITAEGRKFKGTHGSGTLTLPADWPSALRGGVVYRGNYFKDRKYSPIHHLCTAGRSAECNPQSDRATGWRGGVFAGWRGARTAPAGDTIARTAPPQFDATTVRSLARMSAPIRLDNFPDGFGKPFAELGAIESIYPVNNRCVIPDQIQALWQGPADLSAKVYLAWDSGAICVAAEVNDDLHVNTQRGDKIWMGDAMQAGLVTPGGLHYNMALALTTNGVVLHLFTEANDALVQAVDCRVIRDDKAAVTRYALRLPLAVVGLAAGDTFGFNIMFCDADDSKGLRQSIRMTQGISYPFKTELYPRFVLEK